MKDLYIIGAGGFGREVAWLVERINKVSPAWNLKGFIDDDESIWDSKEDGYPVLGGCEHLKNMGDVYAICAVGSAKVRKQIIDKLTDSQVEYATLIDPSVIASERLDIGKGSIICAGSILTVDVKIGKHVIINLDCTVGHDVIIEDYVTVYPSVNISGNVKIGEQSELGTGTQIIQGKKLIEGTILGAGAVVTKDTEESGIYVGVPARKVR